MKNSRTLELDMSLMEALMQYLDHGFDPGSGGRAVLMLDVDLARRSMHELSRHTAKDMVECVSRYFPAESCGSKENIQAWLRSGGIFGSNMEDERALYVLDHPKYVKIKYLKEVCNYHPMRF